MTQLPKKKSRSFENRSSHVAEWASKRQALIEAAKAKREAVQLGEVTEHHTFSPQLRRRKGRSPGSRYLSGVSETSSRRQSDGSPQIVSRDSRSSLNRKDSAVQFDGIEEEMASYSQCEGGGQCEPWAEDQSMGSFPAVDAFDREDVDFSHHGDQGAAYFNFRCDRDEPSLSAREADSASPSGLQNSTSQNSLQGSKTPEEEVHWQRFSISYENRASYGELAERWMKSMYARLGIEGEDIRCVIEECHRRYPYFKFTRIAHDKYGKPLLPDDLDAMREEIFPITFEMNLPSASYAKAQEECYVDETERTNSESVRKLPSLTSSVETEAPQRASLSTDIDMERGLSNWDLDESTLNLLSDSVAINHDQTSSFMQRDRRNPIEYRDLGRSSNNAAECMVATMESLRESPTVRPPRSRMDDYVVVSNNAQEPDSSGVQPPIPPGMVGGMSWKDIGATVPDPSRSTGPRTSQRQHAGQPDTSTSKALQQQECVLDVMRVAELAVRDDGTISLQDLHRFSQGAHEEFLFWLAHCANCVDAGVVHINDLGTAVGKFYLQGVQGSVSTSFRTGEVEAAVEVSEPFSSAAPPRMVCPPPLPSLASGSLLSDGPVHNVPWREAPLRREEVTPSPQRAHRDVLPPPSAMMENTFHQPVTGKRLSSASPVNSPPMSPSAASRPLLDPPSTHVSPNVANRLPLEPSSTRVSPNLASREELPAGTHCLEPEENEKDRERMQRRRYFELKCLELEDQLEIARQAEAHLREELLDAFSSKERRQRNEEAGDASPKATVGKAHERQWLGTAARPQSHTLTSHGASREGQHQSSSQRSSSQRRTNTQRASLSPVQEEPYKELLDSPPQVGEVIHRPQNRDTQVDSPSSPIDDPAELQKLLEMCTRLRKEDDSLPKAEIDSLNDLVKQLAHLMERRREHVQECRSSNEDPEYSVPAFPLDQAVEDIESQGAGLDSTSMHMQDLKDPGANSRQAEFYDSPTSRRAENRLDAYLQSEVNAPERAGNDVLEYEMNSESLLQSCRLDGSESEPSSRIAPQAMEKMVPGSRAKPPTPVVLPPAGDHAATVGYARFAHLTASPDLDEPQDRMPTFGAVPRLGH